MDNRSVIKDGAQYTISLNSSGTTMLFSWEQTPGLTARDFADGITEFAGQCVSRRPSHVVIDARQLDQSSEGVNRLRGQAEVDGLDAYEPWWVGEIVPLYHDAGIASLAVATGDPTAPGEVPTPDDVNFRIGYFGDLEAASTWPSE